jgi:hypothetical protein
MVIGFSVYGSLNGVSGAGPACRQAGGEARGAGDSGQKKAVLSDMV